MNIKNSDWYKYNWSLAMKNDSWVEDTGNQVEFIVQTLGLTGKERILDLACGFGRHALAFARKGYSVVGIDITKELIDDAVRVAKEEGLDAKFLCMDIRDVEFANEFDVVLNLADGAIGYLENEEENLKIFDVIAKSLKIGGKHFMDICNAEHAEAYFPKLGWEIGEKALALSRFEWDKDKRIMVFGGANIPYGEIATKPEIPVGDPIRLYTVNELVTIMGRRNMTIRNTFSNYYGKAASSQELQLMVYSQKL